MPFYFMKLKSNETSITNSYQVPVPSGPVTARMHIAGPGGLGLFGPVTAASRARDSSLLNSTSTGPRTLNHNREKMRENPGGGRLSDRRELFTIISVVCHIIRNISNCIGIWDILLTTLVT